MDFGGDLAGFAFCITENMPHGGFLRLGAGALRVFTLPMLENRRCRYNPLADQPGFGPVNAGNPGFTPAMDALNPGINQVGR